MVTIGISQMASTQEMRRRKWDIADERERKDYIKAMEQWKRDYPTCALIMGDVIGDPKTRLERVSVLEALQGGAR